MADGSTEPIEQIELGDEVWAADPETGEAGARPVTALIEGEGVKDLVTVSTASGSVVATVGHPFWSVSDAAWVDAGDLSVGDAVLQADGATSVVTEVVEVSRPAVVHNLTVADLHTYFVVVGDAPTLVHNSSCPIGTRIQASSDAANSAASNPSQIFIKDKHLSDFGGRFSQFNTSSRSEAQEWVAEGLRSPNAVFMANPQQPSTFRVVVDLGRPVGTNGQTGIRAIVTDDGRVINAFPQRVG